MILLALVLVSIIVFVFIKRVDGVTVFAGIEEAGSKNKLLSQYSPLYDLTYYN